jgi:hypothetical protein
MIGETNEEYERPKAKAHLANFSQVWTEQIWLDREYVMRKSHRDKCKPYSLILSIIRNLW